LLSSVADLLRWDAALGDGRVLPVSTLEAMWTPVKLKNGGTARYGLGWQLDGQGSSRMIHHPGSIAGFQADYVRFPDHNLSIIVLANQDVALPTSVALGVATIYAPSLVPPRIPVQVNPAVLSQYVGSYRLASGATVLVELRDGALYLRPGMTAKEVRLEPESPTSFFADSGDPRLRYVFIRETGGRVLGLSLMDGKSELDRGDRVP
jgi:hypothetical protein